MEKEHTDRPQRNYEDEIDLRKLFQAIGNFFSRIWSGIVTWIVMIRRASLRYLWLLTVCGLLGGVAGVIMSQISEPHYKTSMLLHSSIYRGQLIENSIEKLDLLSSDPEREGLASALNVSTELAKEIKGFEAIPFVSEDEIVQVEILREQLRNLKADEDQINSVIDRIQIENKRTYEIVVRVFDNSIINQLEEPLVNYFRNNPYIAKRLQVTRKNRELIIKKIQQEMNRMDSLKNVVYRNISSLGDRSREGSNNVILAEDNITNPLTIIREDMALYEKELEYQRFLILEPELEMVEGFTVFTKPESPGPLRLSTYGLLLGIALAYIFLILRGINSYLAKVEKEEFGQKEAA